MSAPPAASGPEGATSVRAARGGGLPRSNKALSVSPLKISAPLGAALAFLGVERCLPCLHGTQGCTAFALVLLVRHFREPIPLQTTAMGEVSTILGGFDNVEQALLNIQKRAHPRVIALLTTALTETRGEDMVGDVAAIRRKHRELDDTAVVLTRVPDFAGSLETGWTKAVCALIETLVPEGEGPREADHIAVLPGAHLTPADIEEVRALIEAFGLKATILPDLSDSLDGHVPDAWSLTSLGGTPVNAIKGLGRTRAALVIGEHMRPAGALLEARTGVPAIHLDTVTGLPATDRLIEVLTELSGRPAPKSVRRQRSRLQDALMDAHFFFGGTRIALAGEPDFVWSMGTLLTGLGAILQTVVVPVDAPHLAALPAESILVGDLEDLGTRAKGCDLLIASTNGQWPARHAGVPLFRAGFPVIDRLGVPFRCSVGYRGTRDLVFALGNALIESSEARHAAHDHAEGEPDALGNAGASDASLPASGPVCQETSACGACAPPSAFHQTEDTEHGRPAGRPQAAIG
ncbi:nitrogenase iron-molybdenum cofactor biosynthesis protein NifN [Pararhodospirillum oryzae]|uniref:Nitrogenase molybdenum-cofactor biosynthesis protein NifN n=1 Tax=Pararhodospirillum oryzae TaxID=478448 RepID=A0A512H6N7_9PROT|nr:nitrogenase iron-molybdenum cofactor biosynthesis protein NifN [Pararhodospirillum oryzae]GEO81088.1 nitrogenase molybdenum-cofactor biosynthesis protein NifN [Pararhodospirillum oryzae]